MFATANDAEQAFYRAFETTDIDAMMRVWLHDDKVECIHPGGRRLRGYNAVRNSWAQMFAGGEALRFRIDEIMTLDDAMLVVHVVHEHISIDGKPANRAPIIATNVYRRGPEGWGMILHHASPIAGVGPGAPDAPPAKVH